MGSILPFGVLIEVVIGITLLTPAWAGNRKPLGEAAYRELQRRAKDDPKAQESCLLEAVHRGLITATEYALRAYRNEIDQNIPVEEARANALANLSGQALFASPEPLGLEGSFPLLGLPGSTSAELTLSGQGHVELRAVFLSHDEYQPGFFVPLKDALKATDRLTVAIPEGGALHGTPEEYAIMQAARRDIAVARTRELGDAFAEMSDLRALVLYGITDPSGKFYTQLGNLAELRELSLGFEAISPAELPLLGAALARMPHLEGITFDDLMPLSEANLIYLGTAVARLPSLKKVSIFNTTHGPDVATLLNALRTAPHLTELVLSEVNDGGPVVSALTELLPQLKKLEQLTLSFALTDRLQGPFGQTLAGLTSLKALRFRGSTRLSPQDLQRLAELAPAFTQLEELMIHSAAVDANHTAAPAQIIQAVHAQNAPLRSVDFSFTHLRGDSLDHLLNALAAVPTLQFVGLHQLGLDSHRVRRGVERLLRERDVTVEY